MHSQAGAWELAGVCERIDNLSLKQKIPLDYDNIGGRAGVFVMLIVLP
jgi:hypothetical protein